MVNFKYIQQKFEEQLYDILKYELLYYKDDETLYRNLVDRFQNFIDLYWSNFNIDYNFTKSYYGAINLRIQFNEDPSFGFEFCFDVELMKSQFFAV